MDVLIKTRELGAVIQQDERYQAFIAAKNANDADTELNGLIGKLNLIQMSYQNESAKDTPNEEKLQGYDKEFQDVYALVMRNPHMQAYEAAKHEIDHMMNDVMQLLTMCVNGEDPETCELVHDDGCTGSCSTCGGCH